MTLLYMNGFDHLGAAADLSKDSISYSGASVLSASPRYAGGKYLHIDGYTHNIRCSWGNTGTTSGVVGFAHKCSPGYTSEVVLESDSGSDCVTFLITNSGNLTLMSGPESGDNIHWYQSGLINPQAWNYFEIKYNNQDSPNGYYYVRVNGVLVYSATNIDALYSSYAYVGRLYLFRAGYLDDVYACDLQGTENNDFLGDCRIETLFVSGNGTTNNGTASAGSNYECVDDDSPNDDTDYVTLDAVDEIELYAMDNVATFDTNTSIKAIQVKSLTVKPSVGHRVFQLALRTNSTNYFSSDMGTGVGAYTYKRNMWELNPDDSAAWEEADLNALESGIKITA